MSLSELAEDFERLMPAASNIARALEDQVDGPQDAIFVLAMIASFYINTGRQDNTPLEKATDAFCNLVQGLAGFGEEIGKEKMQ